MKTLAGFARIVGIVSPEIVEKVSFFSSFVGTEYSCMHLYAN